MTSNVLYNDTTGLVKLTSVLSPALVNEARASWHLDVSNFTGNNATTISDAAVGITPLSPVLASQLNGFLPTLIIAGAYTLGPGGVIQYAYSKSYSYQAADQISWTRGKHSDSNRF